MRHMDYQILSLAESPAWKERAARWFHGKWGIPLTAYLESMEECLRQRAAVPQWYLAEREGRIIGGMGVIENDFHPRRDLTPNVCAVYTETDDLSDIKQNVFEKVQNYTTMAWKEDVFCLDLL